MARGSIGYGRRVTGCVPMHAFSSRKTPPSHRVREEWGAIITPTQQTAYATAFVLVFEACPLAAGFARKFNSALLTSSE